MLPDPHCQSFCFTCTVVGSRTAAMANWTSPSASVWLDGLFYLAVALSLAKLALVAWGSPAASACLRIIGEWLWEISAPARRAA
ncbi:uncharacterized protein LOC117645649 [Thrips palmi]|uniref:Uncharacterized protein LOC117645649 n=1 Tax=Thrips palmi TaxID=161013 RepID=A0A6P8Z5C5_THRPL|nr:uncharacterized protein LOC117645649 [Thrips palmi]